MQNNHIHFQQFGQGQDLVLLHGWGFDSGVWHSLVPLLSDEFRVTIVDLPGYGKSAECVFDARQTDKALIDVLVQQLLPQLPEKAIWIGWSLGGLLTTYIAAHFPSRVELIVNIASSPCFVSHEDWPGMEVSVLEQFNQSLLTDHQETLTRFMALQFLGCEQPKQLLQQIKPQLESCGKVSLATLQQGLDLLKNSDLRSQYKTLQIPMLHIFGRLDMLVPVTVIPKLEALNPFCQTVVIDKAAHAPFLSHQLYFVAILKQFIKKQND